MECTRRTALIGGLAMLGVSLTLCESEAGDSPTLDHVLRTRRSIRSFTTEPLKPEDLDALCWAAQGPTSPEGKRTAPSAGALYPLEVFVATAEGVDHYQTASNSRKRISQRDIREQLKVDAFKQPWVYAPAVMMIGAVIARTAKKYGRRGTRYVYLEAGHAAQNVLLQAVALGLGAVPVGAFKDESLVETLGIPKNIQPLTLIAIGRAKTEG